jgi:hypothetical protein
VEASDQALVGPQSVEVREGPAGIVRELGRARERDDPESEAVRAVERVPRIQELVSGVALELGDPESEGQAELVASVESAARAVELVALAAPVVSVELVVSVAPVASPESVAPAVVLAALEESAALVAREVV